MLAPFQLKNDFSMAIPNGMYLKMISRLKIGIKNKYGFIVLRVIFFFMFPSSRLCLDFFTSFHLYSFAMRGSSLKSPSRNRTCPIKAYGSSISLSPNKHLLHISSEFPMDVSLKSPDTFSMSANKTGLCDVYSSRLPASHTQNIL